MGRKKKNKGSAASSNNERIVDPKNKKKQNSKQNVTGTNIEQQLGERIDKNVGISNQPCENVCDEEIELAEGSENVTSPTVVTESQASNQLNPEKDTAEVLKTAEPENNYKSNEHSSDSLRKMKVSNTGKNSQFNEGSKKTKLNQNKKYNQKMEECEKKSDYRKSRNEEGIVDTAENWETEDNWEHKMNNVQKLTKTHDQKSRDGSVSTWDSNEEISTADKSPWKEFHDGNKNKRYRPEMKWSAENVADRYNSRKFRNKSNDKSQEYSSPGYRKSSKSRERADKYYDQFKEKYMRRDENMDFKVVVEEFGDLFLAGEEYSLGHCVAEDMNMGSGIAVTFRQLFKRVSELLDQRQTQGHVAILEDKKRYIYYLVTKRKSSGKPTYYTMWSSLQKMKEHITAHNVKKLALPRIGCGLDSLEWTFVKKMIEYIFQDVEMEIKIYNFQQDPAASTPTTRRKCKVVNYPKPLSDIEYGTIIVYFGSEDGYETDELKTLYNKFPYIRSNYKQETKEMGKCILTNRGNDGYLFFGCIVKRRHTDPFNFTHFQKCLGNIQTRNRSEKYEYVAFQAFLVDGSDSVVSKIINLMRYSLTEVDVYVCWPEELHSYMPRNYNY